MPSLRYQVYLHREVAENIHKVKGSPKRAIHDFIEHLHDDPFHVGDFKKHLSSRDLEVKVIGRYALYYYADHAAKEIKIVEFLHSDLTL